MDHHHHFAAAARPRYNHQPHHQQQPPPSPQFIDPNNHNPPFHPHSYHAQPTYPPPPSRVSNPHPHPHAHPHPHPDSSAFNRDQWISPRDLGPPRFGLFDERMRTVDDEERRRLPLSPYSGNVPRFSNRSPNPNLDFVGERRLPLPQDPQFQDRRDWRSPGTDSFTAYPNSGTGSRSSGGYDRGDSSYSNRYRDDVYVSGFEGEQRLPQPVMRSSSNSYAVRDREVYRSPRDVYDTRVTDRSHGFNEDFAMNENKGKRRLSHGGDDEFGPERSPARQPKKRSALSRIQSGVSVFNRIEQKPSYLSSSTTTSMHALRNEKQLEVDSPDITIQGTTLAKAVAPSSLGMPSSKGKSPDVVAGSKSTPKKKFTKKRKIVVPVSTDLLVSDKKIEDANGKISMTSQEILNSYEELKAPLPYSKSSDHIETKERSPKSYITKEEEHKSTCFEVKLGSDTSAKDSVQQYTFPDILVEASPAQQAATKLMEDSSSNGNVQKDENSLYDVQRHVNSFLDSINIENILLQPYPEEKHKVSFHNDSANKLLSSDALDYGNSDQVPNNPEIHMDTVEDPEYFGHTFVPPTLSVVACVSQGMTPVLCHSDATCDNTTISMNIGDKMHPDSDSLIFRDAVSKELEAGHSGEIEACDAASLLGVKGVSLAVKVKDHGLDQHIKPIDDTEDNSSLNIGDGPHAAECLRQDNGSLKSFLVSESLCSIPSVNSSIVVSDVQETIRHIGIEPCLEELPGTYTGVDNNDRDHKRQRIDIKETALLTKRDPFVSVAEEPIKSETTLLHDQIKHEPQKQITTNSNATDAIKFFKPKNFQSSGIPKVISSQASLGGSLQGLSRSAANAINRTWHRKSSLPSVTLSNGVLRSTKSAPSSKLSPRKSGKPQTSYVRKGNSLIRKAAAADLPPRPSHAPVASSTQSRVAKANVQLDTKGEVSSSLASSFHTIERPKTPPLPFGLNSGSPIPDSPTHSSLALSETPISERGTSIPIKSVGLNFHKSNNQITMAAQVSEPSENKRVMYVKRNLNQLVAASQLKTNLPSHNVEKAQTSSVASDLYYKKKKNQLVRSASSSDNLLKQDLVPPDDRNSEIKKVPSAATKKGNLSGSPKKKLNKVRNKANKHVMFSNVWTLSGDGKSTKVLDYRKVLPLIPWKRVICWTKSSSLLKKYSMSSARQKLYRPTIGGRCSLKWSRSTCRRSKTITKEAKLSAKELEGKRRERKTSTSVSENERRGKSSSCERIYRVGSARYKMDSSRRTLIRLSDDESSTTTTTTKTGVKGSTISSQTSIVPKRLQIGHEEYIRMGNGNQLIRNPKKIVRILANEKVRWSLHTARTRLARKRQYCQFFTRFGECNKKGGKCPYIHDPDKVAICTKFLRGSCSNTTCKLTHEIIPERMPDCSYFLQGLCTNTSCPYRHVNVNSNAVVCDGFLKGYCADGDECLKKHSYVCPAFEATGKCPKGSKCRLHHPKSRIKSKNRNKLMVQNSSWGRYFGSIVSEVSEPLIERQAMEKVAENDTSSHGRFTEYIGLDLNDQSRMDVDVDLDSHQICWDSDESDLEDDSHDALIKPIRIMKRDSTITSADA